MALDPLARQAKKNFAILVSMYAVCEITRPLRKGPVFYMGMRRGEQKIAAKKKKIAEAEDKKE